MYPGPWGGAWAATKGSGEGIAADTPGKRPGGHTSHQTRGVCHLFLVVSPGLHPPLSKVISQAEHQEHSMALPQGLQRGC